MTIIPRKTNYTLSTWWFRGWYVQGASDLALLNVGTHGVDLALIDKNTLLTIVPFMELVLNEDDEQWPMGVCMGDSVIFK
jgi:hypothetical protein